jgi:cytochrome P450
VVPPFLDVLTGTRRRLWRAHRQLDELFDKIIEECEARWKDESAAAGDNLLSIMLRVRDNEEFAFPFGNANIKAIIVVSLSPALFFLQAARGSPFTKGGS